MRYLGIDYGEKRIGLAISDEEGHIAFPRAIIDNDSRTLDLIRKDVDEQKVGHIIVGDTKSYSGLRNDVTSDAEAFIEVLKKTLGLPVEGVFEAGSSIEASRYAPEGETHNDSVAAAVILQRFLDMNGTQ